MPVAGSTLRVYRTPTLVVVQAPLGSRPPWIAIASLSGFPVILTYITITYLRGVCKSKNSYFRVGFVTPALLCDICFDSTVATVDNMSILSLNAGVRGVGVHVGGCREVVSEPVGSVTSLFHVSDYGLEVT